jgi:hypothetical protein
MHAPTMLLAHIPGDDVVPMGRQGREGRGLQSPFGEFLQRNIHIHERRPRTYAREGKNNRDIFSRPSRPRLASADPHSGDSAGSRTRLCPCHRQDPLVIVHLMSPSAEIAKRAA